ncbi:MAG: site-specific DNA-methyltransferase [Bacteroidetes bacterium]|nr:site-specific DNA-methyltransferase [Bacteroidota bacterium]MBU1114127.1 site-specific DNA-methyltransferase [Bacteroidota bacterium]MBU1800543.1 site-specific DNA-methyltransferase [Bacteroidota bacterium]
MDGNSLNISEEKLNKIKEIVPEAFTESKIDWEKLKAALGDNVEFKNERYVLNWAGKSEAFRVLQTPTTATLKPEREESVNFDDTENIFIEGENLEVLKVLQKAYFGKVKMIYIDPPYNTGNDNFIYPDKFSETKDEYLRRIGDKDEMGSLLREGLFRKNSKDSGHYHSNWLSMMYPRLFLARNLLKDDGVIFVSIDDNEVHNLRLLMNEVFGEENFVTSLIWKSRQNVDSRSLNGASNDHEYILCYSKYNGKIRGKEINKLKYQNPDMDPRGPWMSSAMDGIATKDKRPNLHYPIINPISELKYMPSPENGWRFQKSTLAKLISEDRVIWPKNSDSKPRFKRYLNELNNDYTGFSSVLQTVYTTQGTRELRELMGSETLKFPKPSELVKITIEQGSSDIKNDIILDFFSGSATTAHSVLELNKEDGGNRKFILVQLPEKTDENSEAYKAGYKTIADIGKERIRRVIKKIKDENESKLDLDGKANKQDLGFKAFKLQESNFKIWQTKIETKEELEKQIQEHLEPLEETKEREDVLFELLLKSGVELTAKIIKDKEAYIVNDNDIVLLLDKVSKEIVEKVIELNPKKVITIDRLFKNNDQLKTNTALQMKDAGIEFKVV